MLACKYEFLSQEVQLGSTFISNDHMRHEVQENDSALNLHQHPWIH